MSVANNQAGGPLLDLNGHVIGQLHGGGSNDTSCTQQIAYFGRLHISWSSGVDSTDRLKEWLDPINSGVSTLNGLDISGSAYFIEGHIQMPTSAAIPNVEIHVSGDINDVYYSDADGNFSIGPLSNDQKVDLEFVKNTNIRNGLSAIDLSLIQKHVSLLNMFMDPYKISAADVNSSGSPSALDLSIIQKVILLLQADFPNTESWGFEPKMISVEANPGDLQVVGYKYGDVNYTADPSQ